VFRLDRSIYAEAPEVGIMVGATITNMFVPTA
jgi:hypothetical protein